MSEFSEKGSDFVRDLGDAARKNPISAALIGMGVLWLFTGGRTAERVGDLVRGAGFDRIPDAAGNALDAARSTLRSGTESIGNGVSSATETLRDGTPVGRAARRISVSLAPDRKLPTPPTATPKTSRMPAERCSARRATTCLNYSARSPWRWARSAWPSGPALPLRCRQRISKPNISAKPAITSRNRPPTSHPNRFRARPRSRRTSSPRCRTKPANRALRLTPRNRQSPIFQESSAASSMRRAKAFPIG